MKTKTVVFFVIVLGLLLTACGTGGTSATEAATAPAAPTASTDEAVISEGRVEPIRFVEIGFNASGLISEVLVKQGDSVTAGQVIARLEGSDVQTLEIARVIAERELVDANEAVRVAQRSLDYFTIPTELRSMTPYEAIYYSYEKVEKARKDYEPYSYTNKRYERHTNYECRITRGFIEICDNTAQYYEKKLDDAWLNYQKAIQWLRRQAALEKAKARLSEAQKNYEDLQNDANPEETAGIRASLADAELRAPFPGTIAKLDIKVGEIASAGITIATIADFSKWVIKTTDLTEIDIVNVKQGQTTKIILDALPDVELTGTIDSIGQTYSEKQGDIVYEVTIVLNDTNPDLRWGMTAEVKFER
ncbi:MAG: HlyD family efflux transporter periplasmic adaptor subunit [Anaerolineales bacterium]|nr:HlyD family efflux transporter periplasmic adaptor subunit [Anaerolineales bacterium]